MAEQGLGALGSSKATKTKSGKGSTPTALSAVNPTAQPGDHHGIPGRQVGRRWVTPVNLTEKARALLDDQRQSRDKKATYAELAIEALRASEDKLRAIAEQGDQAASTSKWDDEVAQAKQLEGAHRPTSLSMSPGQANALGELADDLGWSLNLTVDTAVIHHFG